MPFPSLTTRIEQARAFHGDDFALIADKCGCTESKVREVVAKQDATAVEDDWVLEQQAREQYEQLMAARRAVTEQRLRLLAELRREQPSVAAHAQLARDEARRAHRRGYKRAAGALRKLAREDVA